MASSGEGIGLTFTDGILAESKTALCIYTPAAFSLCPEQRGAPQSLYLGNIPKMYSNDPAL